MKDKCTHWWHAMPRTGPELKASNWSLMTDCKAIRDWDKAHRVFISQKVSSNLLSYAKTPGICLPCMHSLSNHISTSKITSNLDIKILSSSPHPISGETRFGQPAECFPTKMSGWGTASSSPRSRWTNSSTTCETATRRISSTPSSGEVRIFCLN